MRITKGFKQTREHLLEKRQPGFSSINPAILKKSSDILGKDFSTIDDVVIEIINRVKKGGDTAIRKLSNQFDGLWLDQLVVPDKTICEAYQLIDPMIVDALKISTKRAQSFHKSSLPKTWFDSQQGYGESINPVQRVGAYIPGGSAPLPSTVIMTVIPAKIAGVKEVFLFTPSTKTGSPDPSVLVAADIVGADKVFQIGGAQAIAAMAYGTETIPPVDLICGPGNIFVTRAKKFMFGEVGIDGLYGPTETLIIADETADPALCAADLLAQAEHDVMAMPILLTSSELIGERVLNELMIRVKELDRSSIATIAVEEHGCIGILNDLEEMIQISNEFAPEHISLMVSDAANHVNKIRNAGAIFVGKWSHEVLGDYVAGPSHVMPTGGTAKFISGLNVRTFLKFSPVVNLEKNQALNLSKTAATIGRAEGLTAHSKAAEMRENIKDISF